MIDKNDIQQLAILARVAVSPDEEEALAKDLDAVLAYVSEVSDIATNADLVLRAGPLRNVMREDSDVYAGGGFTDAILANAPKTEDGYLKVNKIL